jgi:F-type H+-transporting ATPase subunit delta
MTLLAKRYAEAVYASAKAQGAVDTVAADLHAIQQNLAAPAAKALLTSPDVTPAERTAVLDKLVAGRHTLTKNLVGVLQHRRRLEVLFSIADAFTGQLMAERGEVEGVAESAYALSADELAALTTLAGRLSGKKVKLTAAVRAELLGGVRLRDGNVLYDGSLRASLDQLQHKLAQASV